MNDDTIDILPDVTELGSFDHPAAACSAFIFQMSLRDCHSAAVR